MNVAHATGVVIFGTIADWNSVEFARRLYGLAVSAFTPPGRLDLHPIEFNRRPHYHGSPSKEREAYKILAPAYGSTYFSFQSHPSSHGDRGGQVGR